MGTVCVVSFVVCIASFLWAMAGNFFQRVEPPSRGFRAIQVLGGASIVVTLWAYSMSAVTPEAGAAGLMLYAGSFALFWASIRVHWSSPPSHAFSMDIPTHLVEVGPYRYLRHPCYSAYVLTWLAGAVATMRLTPALAAAVMFVLYHRAATLEEAKYATSTLASAYAAYQRQTGRFVPKFKAPCHESR
jgi:protein-S-isoprenylcysteine O-methyltransferase Ste14